MLDREGYRPNVGIILCNAKNEVFWGKRIREHSWQFPQGGINRGEAPEHAMFRELYEEIGLKPEHVAILGRTREWLRYDVPTHWIKREWRGSYRGQKQIWFLLRFLGRDCEISLRATDHPEFDAWCWHPYWVSLDSVIEFKRGVYENALNELVRYLDADKRSCGALMRKKAKNHGCVIHAPLSDFLDTSDICLEKNDCDGNVALSDCLGNIICPTEKQQNNPQNQENLTVLKGTHD